MRKEDEQEINEDFIIDFCWSIIKKDREYCDKYIKDSVNRTILEKFAENVLSWRMISNRNEVKNIIENNNENELMRLEDYYSDELYSLLMEKYEMKDDITEDEVEKIYEEMYSEENLIKLYNEEMVSQQVKDCILLYLNSNSISKMLLKIKK